MNILSTLRTLILQDNSVEVIKEALFNLALDVRQQERDQPAKQTDSRFAINVPAESRWDSIKQVYVEQPARIVYFIDGAAYMSKIISIKVIRERDGIGLRDAKDIVDRLEETAITAKARF